MVKGPIGCGKSHFVEYMAWKPGKLLSTVQEIAAHHLTIDDLEQRPTLQAALLDAFKTGKKASS